MSEEKVVTSFSSFFPAADREKLSNPSLFLSPFFLSLSLHLKTEKERSIPLQVFVHDQSL